MTASKLPLVLFLCTANSAHSQMAEALLRHKAADRFRNVRDQIGARIDAWLRATGSAA